MRKMQWDGRHECDIDKALVCTNPTFKDINGDLQLFIKT